MNNKIREIYKNLLEKIAEGEINPGTPLPRETDIAEEFDTNRMNAHRAVKELEKHGLVKRKKRFGTYLDKNLEKEEITRLVNEVQRNICVLYSMKPFWIHWNEASFDALEEQVKPYGYSVIYKNIPSNSNRKDYISLLREISDNGTSALVIFPDTFDTDYLRQHSDLLLDLPMPVFMLNRSGEELPFDMVSFVSMDPFGDGVIVGTLLRKSSCKNVLMLNEDTGKYFWGIKRFEGLTLGLNQGKNGSSVSPENIIGTPEGINETVKKIKKLKGDVVVVPINNQFAAELIDCSKKQNLTIPDDYRLITFDDNPLYRSYNLTTMSAPMSEIGQLFGKMICENSWLSAHKGKISIRLPGKLIFRDTYRQEF